MSPQGTEGEGSPPAPSPFSHTDGFSFEPGVARPGLGDPPAPTPPLSRYRPLTNTPSQEGLSGPPAPQSCPSSDSSPGFARRDPRPRQHSEGETPRAPRGHLWGTVGDTLVPPPQMTAGT